MQFLTVMACTHNLYAVTKPLLYPLIAYGICYFDLEGGEVQSVCDVHCCG